MRSIEAKERVRDGGSERERERDEFDVVSLTRCLCYTTTLGISPIQTHLVRQLARRGSSCADDDGRGRAARRSSGRERRRDGGGAGEGQGHISKEGEGRSRGLEAERRFVKNLVTCFSLFKAPLPSFFSSHTSKGGRKHLSLSRSLSLSLLISSDDFFLETSVSNLFLGTG